MRLSIYSFPKLVHIDPRAILLFGNICTIAAQVIKSLCHADQGVKMGGEEGTARSSVVQVMQTGIPYSNTIFWGRSTANFIHDDLIQPVSS